MGFCVKNKLFFRDIFGIYGRFERLIRQKSKKMLYVKFF